MIKTVKSLEKRSTKLSKPTKYYQYGCKLLLKYFPLLPSRKKYNITISSDKKFIWFRVPKVGTRTIFNILDKGNVRLDAENVYSCHYPVNYYRKYFKFAFVRNPWDRLVSCWYDKVINTNLFNFSDEDREQMSDFKNFVNYASNLDIRKCDAHLRRQTELIDLNNIDFIGRYENFEEDLNIVMERIGIEKVEIEKINVSKGKKHYSKYYDDETIRKVAELYSTDINLFSYKFNS